MADKITFNDKAHINPYGTREIQVWDLDINEIKSVVNNNANETAANTANVKTNAIAKATLAEIQALTGNDETLYYVLDDPTPSNNGAWGWATPGWYKAADAVNAGTFDANDNVTPATQKAIADWVNSLVPVVNDGVFDPADNVLASTQKSSADWVDSTKVDKSDIVSSSLINENYVVDNVLIGGDGSILPGPYAGAKTIVDQPLEPNTTYTIGGYNPANKRIVLVDDVGSVYLNIPVTTLPYTFTTDTTHFYLRATLKHSSESTDDDYKKAMLNEGGELEFKGIIEINEQGLIPDPTYVAENFVLQSEVDWYSLNLFTPDFVTPDFFVHSSGSILGGAGYAVFKTDVSHLIGQNIAFNNMEGIGNGVYFAFHNSINGLISVEIADRRFTKTAVVPAESKWFYLTVKLPADPDDTVYEYGIVNVGTELIAYEPYKELITEIDGRGLEPYISKVKAIESGMPIVNASKQYYNSRRKPTISFVWDDLNATDPAVFDLFQEYGYLPSFGLPSNKITDATIQAYQDYYIKGCSILAHSIDGPAMNNPASITYEEVDRQMTVSKEAIESYGIKVSGWVTPNSSLDNSFFPLMEKNFGYGFTNLNSGSWVSTVDPLKMARYGLETAAANHNTQAVKDRIDLAITNNELVVMYGHQLPSTYLNPDQTPYLTVDDMRGILDYLKIQTDANLCQVLSCDEAVFQYYKEPWA